jgi:hypothetical protein
MRLMHIVLVVINLQTSAPSTLVAGAWTLEKGHLWTKITALRQVTDEEYLAVGGTGREPDIARFFEPGDRARYRENGHYDSLAIFIDLFYGLTDRIDVGVQIPYFRQKFENIGFRPANIALGFSDIRGVIKTNLIRKPFVGTLKWGFKAPTGKFGTLHGIIPVGEGQWDFDLIAQLGRSLWPLPIYANLDVGHRLRLKNSRINRAPGNEWFYNAELGFHPINKLLIAIKLEGIRGQPATAFGLKLPRDVKNITYITPTLQYDIYPKVSLETALRITAGGRNFPAVQMWVAGLSFTSNPFGQ